MSIKQFKFNINDKAKKAATLELPIVIGRFEF